jgi:hypothetical protein
MSTRSEIYVKIEEADKGKELSFDFTKIPTHEGRFNYIPPKVKLEGGYIGGYCHFDGYLSGVGKELFTHYKTYEEALNLVLGGELSQVCDEVVHYYSWRGEKEDPWERSQPKQLDEEPNEINQEYLYLFKDGEWYYRSIYDASTHFKPLSEHKEEMQIED